ncbi:hypothetical protein [Bacillus sp. ISL-46]|uniref:hypothetical protein n=1 Tax=Bacillus sp. ISL-46 TaxID=2819129 RepID=UPI0020359F87|nr:hypothetical protein [Bacillus sp. ISL-46]
MISLSKNKWLWFTVVLSLGSLFDFIITIPLLVYFFILRKRYSLKYILPVMIAGYGAAVLIIPHGLLSAYPFVKYILFTGEAAFFLLELYVVIKLFTSFPKIIKSYRKNESKIPTFPYRMKQAWEQHLQPSPVREIFFSDMTIYYFSLFSWRKKPMIPNELIYTYHKKYGHHHALRHADPRTGFGIGRFSFSPSLVESASLHYRSGIKCVYLIILSGRNPSNSALPDYDHRPTIVRPGRAHQTVNRSA